MRIAKHWFLFFGLFLPFLSVSEEVDKKLVIGVEAIPFHPHYWLDRQDRSYKGYANDLFQRFAEVGGYEIEFKPYAPENLLSALLSGEIDFKYPDHSAWGADLKKGAGISYSEPVVAIVDGSLVNPRKLYQGIAKVNKVGTIAGFTPWVYNEFIESGQVEVVEFDNLKHLTRAAIKNEVDAVYFNVIAAIYFIDHFNTLPFILNFDDTLPYVKDSFHISSINRPEVINAFNSFLQTESDWVSSLKERYGVERNLDNEYLGVQQWQINFKNRFQ